MVRVSHAIAAIAVVSFSVILSNSSSGQTVVHVQPDQVPGQVPGQATGQSLVSSLGGPEESNVNLQLAKPAEVFPDTTIALLHVENPAKILNTILNHPLRESIVAFEDVRKILKSTEFKQMNVARRVLEMQLEMEWDEAIEALTVGGLDVAFDAKTNSMAVIATARDEKTLNSIVDKLVELAGESEKLLKVKVPLEESEYRSLRVFQVGPVLIGVMKNQLLISNHQQLAKQIADRYLDGNARNSLASQAQFKKSQSLLKERANARLYLDLSVLRNVDNLKPLFGEKTENIGIEFLFGGIQSNLREADYAVANVSLNGSKLEVQAATPHRASWVAEPREFFFGKNGKGEAPRLLVPENALFALTSYRDIGQLWLSKEDLFEEAHIAELAQADSQFSTIFSGLDFGEEILGATRPGFQIVSAIQDYSNLKTPNPDIEIPSFAFIFRLKEPEKIQQRFKVGFQSVVGFANIALSQQGQPQLDIETEKFKDGRLVTTSYLVDEANKDEGLINYNFSPSIAFVGDHFIVSSTESLARELVELARKPGRSTGGQTNTFVELDGKMLRKILNGNRESLIAQNMLEEGNSQKEAEQQIDQLLKIVEQAENASFKFENHADRLQINLELNFDSSGAAK